MLGTLPSSSSPQGSPQPQDVSLSLANKTPRSRSPTREGQPSSSSSSNYQTPGSRLLDFPFSQQHLEQLQAHERAKRQYQQGTVSSPPRSNEESIDKPIVIPPRSRKSSAEADHVQNTPAVNEPSVRQPDALSSTRAKGSATSTTHAPTKKHPASNVKTKPAIPTTSTTALSTSSSTTTTSPNEKFHSLKISISPPIRGALPGYQGDRRVEWAVCEDCTVLDAATAQTHQALTTLRAFWDELAPGELCFREFAWCVFGDEMLEEDDEGTLLDEDKLCSRKSGGGDGGIIRHGSSDRIRSSEESGAHSNASGASPDSEDSVAEGQRPSSSSSSSSSSLTQRMAARLAGNTHALSAFLADVRDWDAFRLFARRRSGRLPRVWSDRLTPHSRRPSLTSGTIKHPGGKYDETASTSSSGSTDYEACESASAHSYPSSLLHDEEELRKEFARQEADWQTEKRVLQCALRDAEEKVEAAIRVMTGALADMKGSNNGSTTHLCSSLRHGNCVQVMTSPRSSSAGRPMTDTPTDSALSESLTKISPSGDKLHATPSSSSSSPRRSTPATFLKSSTVCPSNPLHATTTTTTKSSLSSRRSTPKHPYLTHHHHPSSGNKPSRRSLSKKVSFGNDTIWREHDESNRSCCNDVGSAVVDDHHASSSESTSDMYVDAPMQQQQPVMAIPTSIPSPTRRSFDSIRDAQPPQPRQLLRKRASYDIASSTSTLYKLNNVSFVAKKQQAEESLPCFDGGEDSSGAEDPIGKLKGGGGGMMGQRKTTRSVDIPPRIPDSPPAYAQSTNIDAATHPPSPPSTAHHPDMIPTPLSLVEVEKRRPIDPSIPPAESVESSLSLSSSSSAASSNNDFPVIHIPPPVVSGCLDPTPPPPPQIPAKPSPDHQNHQPTLPKRRSFLATFNRSDQLTMIRPTCDGLSTGEAQLQIQSMAAATSAGGGQEGTMTRKWGKLLRGRG